MANSFDSNKLQQAYQNLQSQMITQFPAQLTGPPQPVYKVGDKVICVQGREHPDNTSDHNRGGNGWELGYVFEVTEIAKNVNRGADVLFGGNNGNGVYSDWVVPFVEEKKSPPKKQWGKWALKT